MPLCDRNGYEIRRSFEVTYYSGFMLMYYEKFWSLEAIMLTPVLFPNNEEAATTKAPRQRISREERSSKSLFFWKGGYSRGIP